MIHINPNTITHIKVFNLIEGVYLTYGRLVQCTYVPYKKGGFFRDTVDEGYYENGLPNTLFGASFTMDEIAKSTKIFAHEGKLYHKAHIEIYSGKELIHTEYFPSNMDMEYHINDKYKHINIRYQND